VQVYSIGQERLRIEAISDPATDREQGGLVDLEHADVVALRDALSAWLDNQPVLAPRREHWCGEPNPHRGHIYGWPAMGCQGGREDRPEPATDDRWAQCREDIAHMRRVADEAIGLLKSLVPPSDPVDADDADGWDELAAEGGPLTGCGVCAHEWHGGSRCTEGGRGLHACQCTGAKSADPVADTQGWDESAAEAVLAWSKPKPFADTPPSSDLTCVCGHGYTLHSSGCEGRHSSGMPGQTIQHRCACARFRLPDSTA
jgi:hypothetical protein